MKHYLEAIVSQLKLEFRDLFSPVWGMWKRLWIKDYRIMKSGGNPILPYPVYVT